MVKVFVNEFPSVCRYHDPSTPAAAHQVFSVRLNNIYLSLFDVVESCAVLNTSTSLGPDSIQPLLLHSLPSLALPLHITDQQNSFTEGTLPTSWKHLD